MRRYSALKICLGSILMLFSPLGAAKEYQHYPISFPVHTTETRSVLPVAVPSGAPLIYPYELSKYSVYGYGKWQYGPGVPREKRFDIMPSSYTGSKIKSRTNLLHFFSISDIHLRDKESPAQAIYWGYTGRIPLPSAYSGTMLYSTHILDATIQTINALDKRHHFDFGISLGDACHGTQYNELRWFIDVLDGKKIIPSSGSHVGSHTIDYQKPYKAAGLHTSIPWYIVKGNADRFWYGYLTPNSYIQKNLVGKTIINLGNPFTSTHGADTRGFFMGSINGKTPYGTIMGVGAESLFRRPPQVFKKDPNRHSLSEKEWIGEFFKTSSHPKGHGFKKKNKEEAFACYTFEPKSDLPLKVLVLDDLENRDTPSNPLAPGQNHGYLDSKRYHWLLKELAKGQAQNKLMIVAAHIAIGATPPTPSTGWLDPIFEEALISQLHTYPNLIMWMAGHYHRNMVTPMPSKDPAHPEQGFWVVETASLIQFPQQFRTFTLVRNSDNTISIVTTNVDPSVKRHSPAAKSRLYSIGAMQLFKNSTIYPPSGAYNAELFKLLTPTMRNKIKNCR